MARMDSDRELTPDLTAPQVQLYEAFEEIAEELGQFGQDAGPHGSHYMAESPFAEDGMVCSNCAFYAGPRACEIVSGDIAPEGVCKFWIIPERLMSEQPEMEEGRPYPNEHAARLRDPGQYDRFRRRNDAGGKGVDFIFGIKEGESGAELQAIRFKLSEFTAAEARAWLRERDYEPLEFEEATGERSKVEQIEAEPVTAERAAPDALQEGDFVSWNSSGGRARGRIEHVMREGTLGVPGTEFSIDASEEDPAALIRIYREGEATETMVGHRFSTLTKIESIGDRSWRASTSELRVFSSVLLMIGASSFRSAPSIR